jgi:hypothetical protein
MVVATPFKFWNKECAPKYLNHTHTDGVGKSLNSIPFSNGNSFYPLNKKSH